MDTRSLIRSRAAAGAAAALTAVWLLVALPPFVYAADAPPSNLDLMTELGTQVVGDAVAKIDRIIAGKKVRIRPFAGTEEYVFMDNIFTRTLSGKGVAILGQRSGASGANSEDFVLDYQLTVFELSYPKVYRSYLIGGKRVKREADIRLSVRLVDPSDDAVVWIGDSDADHSDQFSQSDIGSIQEGTYQFVKPEMPGSGWGKVVEPVFVSAIVVGMIYLFFSNQSAN